MPSFIGHAVVGLTLAHAMRPTTIPRGYYLMAAVLPTLPDLDVIGFAFGIDYGAPLGHRGLSHSLAFAAVLGVLGTWLLHLRRELTAPSFHRIALILALITATHGLLDMATDAGLGIALFAPFDNGRYFLPWRPIATSYIGLDGWTWPAVLQVAKSELLWLGLPCALLVTFTWLRRRRL